MLTGKVGQTGLVFGMRSGFISRSVHPRLQVYMRSGYDFSLTWLAVYPVTHKQHFDQFI